MFKDGPNLNDYEYEMLTGRASLTDSAAAYTFEFLYEMGWVDTLGIITPRGEKVVSEYEDFHKPSYSQGSVPEVPGARR